MWTFFRHSAKFFLPNFFLLKYAEVGKTVLFSWIGIYKTAYEFLTIKSQAVFTLAKFSAIMPATVTRDSHHCSCLGHLGGENCLFSWIGIYKTAYEFLTIKSRAVFTLAKFSAIMPATVICDSYHFSCLGHLGGENCLFSWIGIYKTAYEFLTIKSQTVFTLAKFSTIMPATVTRDSHHCSCLGHLGGENCLFSWIGIYKTAYKFLTINS